MAFAWRLAERLGKTNIDFIDKLTDEELATWQALSIVDDWSGEYRAVVEYRVYMLMIKAACAICGFCGVKVEENELLQFWEVLPLREKPKRELKPVDVDQLREQLAKRYG